MLPPHGEDADEEGERCHDNLTTTSLSTTFSQFFSNHHLPGLGGTEFTVATEHLPEYIYDCRDPRFRVKLSQSGWHLWTHLTVGVSIVASPVRGPAVARALRRNRSDLLFTRLSIHSCVKDIPE